MDDMKHWEEAVALLREHRREHGPMPMDATDPELDAVNTLAQIITRAVGASGAEVIPQTVAIASLALGTMEYEMQKRNRTKILGKV